MPSQLELDLVSTRAASGARSTRAASGARSTRAASGARSTRAGARGRGVVRALGLLGSGLVAWAPIWMPAMLVLQITLLGLLPARAEARRLDRARIDVEQREVELEQQSARLERRRRMLGDDIYRERLRQSRVRGPAGVLFEAESPR